MNKDEYCLLLLENWDYLDTETQNNIKTETDVNEYYKVIDEISIILNRKKNKNNWNKENFLSTENEENLKEFLSELEEIVRELTEFIWKSVSDILRD